MSPFQFKDIKTFLRAYIHQLPGRGRGEISRIGKHLRVSATLVSQVLSGEKYFTPEQASALARYLRSTPLETEYLQFLVQWERAGSSELKAFWRSRLDEIQERSLKVSQRVEAKALSEAERAVFYSNPLYAAVSLYASTGTKESRSLEEICQRFELDRVKAIEILQFLLRTDLCRERDGRYSQGAQKTHLDESSPHVLRHHCNWRLRAVQKGEELSKQELMYTAPVSLSQMDFQALREEMVVFIKRFLEKVHASPPEEIACFNMDFFWIKK